MKRETTSVSAPSTGIIRVWASLVDHIVCERRLPTSGRGVSEPLQLKWLAQTGSAGPNETIPEGTVDPDVVEMSEASNKALNRK